jgi:hypothetical protein
MTHFIPFYKSLHTHIPNPAVVEYLSLRASPPPSFSLVREIRHLQQLFLSSGGVQLCHLTLSDFLVAVITIKEFILQGDVAQRFVPGGQTCLLVLVTW